MELALNNNAIIKVIGVGGGGGNAVSYMYRQGIVGVDFAICNTDIQALDGSPIPTKIQLGPHLTEGMGAGSVPEMGKQSCIESIDDVRKFLENNTKMLFITAGMGGGTGTGAAPIIAKAAREMGILTVAIVTTPFQFEGLRRKTQAIEGLECLKKSVDSILVISNERLKDLYSNLSLSNAFAKADDILATAAKGIAEIITVPGYINVDFKDVETVMKGSGVSIMGYAEASGEDRAEVVVKEALNSPLLEDNDIRGAQHILLNVSSGTEEVSMEEVGLIMNYVQEEAGYGTHIIFGNSNDKDLGDNISITIIATGFTAKHEKMVDEEAKTIVVSLDDVVTDMDIIDLTDDSVREDRPVRTKQHEVHEYNDKAEPFVKPVANIEDQASETIRREYLRKSTSVPLNSPKTITDMESVPAYKRRKVNLDDIIDEKVHKESILSINFDENDVPSIERNNSYFHDNVD